jgi:hypothetical protein
MAMTVALIAVAGVFTCSHGQTSCRWEWLSNPVFKDTLWRQPTESESLFWVQKVKDAGYHSKSGCFLKAEDKKELTSSIMDWAIADPKDPISQTTEVSRMVDRVFQKATPFNRSANPPEHAVWDKVVREQKTTAPELFALITPDLVIKEVTDVPNNVNAESVHIVNQGKFSARLASVLRLEINNGPGCTGTVSRQAEFGVPVLKAGEDIWVKVTSTERLKQTGIERLAYKLTLDAKKSVAESNEDNNEKCVPAYVIK